MPEIEIYNEQQYPVNHERLREAVAAVIAQENAAPDSVVSVVITDNDGVAALNLEYRGIDAPTDVLSFPSEPLPEELRDALGDEDEDAAYLGDLVIAFPYASAQAEREQHALDDSLGLLVVHGTLHLLGYDHDTPERKAVMWAAQARALETLGIPTHIVPALEGDHGDEQARP
ncbi:MAG TPA: rRNA maturation RNase YbeY [Aggregatilineales bacterium]|jgi:probable rRNA maturation factor|nr:rRNA maturation RNase YbeY [Aggregatilineales bacterium]